MQKTHIRIIQISTDSGDHKGLYLIYKEGPIEPICEEIRETFKEAGKKEDAGEVEDFHEYADELLEKKRIIRAMADEVFIPQFQ